MTFVKWYLLIVSTISFLVALSSPALIGEPRKPISASTISILFVSNILHMICVYIIWINN